MPYSAFDHVPTTTARSARGIASPRPEIGELFPLVHSFLIAHERLNGCWRRGMDISVHERLALAHLWAEGTLTMRELADRIPLSTSAMTHLADRLEAIGYVERTSDPADRRRTLLRATEKAAKRKSQLMEPFVRDFDELMGSFDEAGQEAIRAFLVQTEAMFRRHVELTEQAQA